MLKYCVGVAVQAEVPRSSLRVILLACSCQLFFFRSNMAAHVLASTSELSLGNPAAAAHGGPTMRRFDPYAVSVVEIQAARRPKLTMLLNDDDDAS